MPPASLWGVASLVVAVLTLLGVLLMAPWSTADSGARTSAVPVVAGSVLATTAAGPSGAIPSATSTGPPGASAPAAARSAAPGDGSAAPYVQPFANGLSATPQAALSKPTAPVTVDAGIDGCDHAYGSLTQCVPWQFPPGVTDGCAWLRAHGFGPLAVHGRDRHHLDTNNDGTACGPGDTP
jgi:hypothetical protein